MRVFLSAWAKTTSIILALMIIPVLLIAVIGGWFWLLFWAIEQVRTSLAEYSEALSIAASMGIFAVWLAITFGLWMAIEEMKQETK